MNFFKFANYKMFNSTAFHMDLQNKRDKGPKIYQNIEETFASDLHAHTPR